MRRLGSVTISTKKRESEAALPPGSRTVGGSVVPNVPVCAPNGSWCKKVVRRFYRSGLSSMAFILCIGNRRSVNCERADPSPLGQLAKGATQMIAEAAETRFCESCLTAKPLTEFRRRTRESDDRLGQCRQCHNAAERTRRAAGRARRDSRDLAKFVSQAKRATNPANVQALIDRMIDRFGGLDDFCARWKAIIDAAIEAHQHRLALDAFRAIANLIVLNSKQHGDRQSDLEGLDEEDLIAAFRALEHAAWEADEAELVESDDETQTIEGHCDEYGTPTSNDKGRAPCEK